MRGYVAFLKKEWMESIRSYRILILGIVFLLFGLTSSLMAKMLPEIIASMPMEGMTITIPEPTALDSYSQFFKNTAQMGSVALLLVFSGVLSMELSRGTLINVLTKGLSRTSVILAKYTMMTLIWTVVYSMSALISYGYTVYLFEDYNVTNTFYALFMFWIFGLFLLALLMLGSVLFSGNYSGLIFTAGIVALLLFVGMIPECSDYSPMTLASANINILDGTMKVQDTILALVITCAVTFSCILGSVVIFRKKIV